MPGTIDRLPDLEVPGHLPSQPDGANHPMRVMTRRAAGLQHPPWERARREVAGRFDRVVAMDLSPGVLRPAGAPPGDAEEAWSRAGVGTWTVLRRAR